MFFLKLLQAQKREVAQKMTEFEEVLEADVVFVEYDVIARMATVDVEKLQDFVSDKVRTVPNVLVTSTMIILREYMEKNHRSKNK